MGVEGLRRFVEEEPLYRVHECAFAVLALESEPLTPGYESQHGEWAAKTLYGHRKGKRHIDGIGLPLPTYIVGRGRQPIRWVRSALRRPGGCGGKPVGIDGGLAEVQSVAVAVVVLQTQDPGTAGGKGKPREGGDVGRAVRSQGNAGGHGLHLRRAVSRGVGLRVQSSVGVNLASEGDAPDRVGSSVADEQSARGGGPAGRRDW